ncbi:MAG: hypothetical protein ABI382_13560 [Nakamurella sp.]
MRSVERIDDLRAAWRRAANAPEVTAEIADTALRAMKLNAERFLDEQRPIASRISLRMCRHFRLS